MPLHALQGSRLARLAFRALTLFFLLFAALAGAAQERYDYDALGRLIRVIDEQRGAVPCAREFSTAPRARWWETRLSVD